MLTGGALKAIELARTGDHLRARLHQHAQHFRNGLQDAGFRLLDGEHPIIPVMLDEAKLAQEFASRLYELGVYVTGFSIRLCPEARPAFVYKCQRRCQPSNWIKPSPHLCAPGVTWE